MRGTAGYVTAALLLALAACGSATARPVRHTLRDARAFGIWRPAATDTCSRELHDSYSVLGPDGARYPAWHPANGPGCTFGHEHGPDPRGSHLHGWARELNGGLPFGLANEAWAAGHEPRDEDHVGHKVAWANDVALTTPQGAPAGVTCDYLVKVHQGTHSADAFANNLHEVQYYARCTDDTAVALTVLAAIGQPGEFVRNCDRTTVVATRAAKPAASPAGGGARFIPDRTCLTGKAKRYAAPALFETWLTDIVLTAVDGTRLAHVDPSFGVRAPSRFYDPSVAGGLSRTTALCGGTGVAAAVRERCPVFDGADREVLVNQTDVHNSATTTTWFSDALGQGARTRAFPGALKQFVCRTTTARTVAPAALTGGVPFDAVGVHAPN